MNRLVYLVGQPGSGKSTLMRRLTEGFDRHSIAPAEHYPVAHDVLTGRGQNYEGEVVGAELGIRREAFSGTDALPSSIIDKAVPWVASRPYPLILAEGARLANKRFLTAAHDDGGYEVVVALLDHPDAEAWRRKRARQLGRDQNASWVKGRLSASRNLADQLEGRDGFTVVRGAPDELSPILAAYLAE